MATPKDKRLGSFNSHDLPADVILEILLRLPVKSLSRFKCVSKEWCTLIGSRSFVDRHFIHKSHQERLFVRNYKPEEDLYSFALFVDEICSGYEEPDHLQMPDTIDCLIGPVHGVFCVVGQSRKVALLNPAMRQFKPLPSPDLDIQPHLVAVDNVLGFGLDQLSRDYKVISIRYFWDEELDVLHYPPLINVYSSGSDSWRHFEDVGSFNPSYSAYRSLCNTYSNGFYYWLMECHDSNVAAILAFDMTNEKFQEMQVPDCVKSRIGHLTLYGCMITLLSYDLEKIDTCDIWVMQTEGCWFKILTIGPFQDISWPLCFWNNYELLLETESSLLALFHVFSRHMHTVEVRVKENTSFLSWVFSYKETLVSVKREGDNCMLWDASSDSIKHYLED